MRKGAMVFVLLLAFCLPMPAWAQVVQHFSALKVDIWPEYDRPAVLVISHITLDPAASLPFKFTLRVPAQADVTAVAVVDASGGLLNAPYTSKVQGDWAELTISANSTQVQVEYYNVLVKNGQQRHIVYAWPGDAAVDAFMVEFQQPADATGLVLDPAAATSSTYQSLTYYQTAPVSLAAGQGFTLTADYQKPNNNLSIAGMPVQSAQPLSPSILGNMPLSRVMTILLMALGAMLLVGLLVGLIIWRANRRKAVLRRAPQEADEGGQMLDETVYCSQCGKRGQAGDIFCRSCGARLRRGA